MRKAKCKFKKIRLTILGLTLITIISLVILVAIEKNLEPKIADICKYYCKSEITRIASQSVYEIIEENNVNYDDIIIKLEENGKISAIDISSENVNRLKSAVTEKININFKDKCRNEISIPLGSVSDLFFLSGKGPEIKMQFLPEAYVSAHISSDFSDAGINQTRHTIYLEVAIEAIAVLPSENIRMTVDSNYILAETIYIGDIPLLYS